jgi:CRP-like cAMP-binding protein
VIDREHLARLSLFADLSGAQLEMAAAVMDEERFAQGTRVLRRSIGGSAFYVILEGEVSVRIDDQERARLVPGDFFGEGAILTRQPPGADVVVVSEQLHCATLPEPELEPLLLQLPRVALRMLETMARRLHAANLWRG